MSGHIIVFTYIIMSYVIMIGYFSVYQMLDKIKAHKTGKLVEYWDKMDQTTLFLFSPITIFVAILYELNKLRNIIISKLASLLVDFDLSKVKNIF